MILQGNRFTLNKFIAILISSIFLFTAGYLFSETPKQPKEIKKEAQEVIKKAKQERSSYFYVSSGKRDPFRSPLLEAKSKTAAPETENGKVLESLRKFNIGTLKLIGIVSTKTENIAMVTAPDGKSYVLKKNTKVGPNGTVKEVNKDKVIIEEKYKVEEKNYLGEATSKTVSNEIVLSLGKKEGGNT